MRRLPRERLTAVNSIGPPPRVNYIRVERFTFATQVGVHERANLVREHSLADCAYIYTCVYTCIGMYIYMRMPTYSQLRSLDSR